MFSEFSLSVTLTTWLLLLLALTAVCVQGSLSILNEQQQQQNQETKRYYPTPNPNDLPYYGYPFSFNTSTELFKVYTYEGPTCSKDYLISMETQPLYQPSQSCLQVSPGVYQQSHCTYANFILREECDEECKMCAKMTTLPLQQCTPTGDGHAVIRMCGELPRERPPKMLWKLQHEENGKTSSCIHNKVIKVNGTVIKKKKPIWIPRGLRGKIEDDVSCDIRDYNDGKNTGKIGICKGNLEYECS